MLSRIICVGNRLREQDAAGPRVHDRLAASTLPSGVELVDGGLGGLDLARFVIGADRVVFVDSVAGFGAEGGVVVLPADEIAALASVQLDHAAGLPYLLRALPLLGERGLGLPWIAVVGVEGEAGPVLVERAAATALHLALEGDA